MLSATGASSRQLRPSGAGASWVGGVLAAAAAVALVVVLVADAGDDGGGTAPAGAMGDFREASVDPAEITDLGEAVEASGCELERADGEGATHVPEGREVGAIRAFRDECPEFGP